MAAAPNPNPRTRGALPAKVFLGGFTVFRRDLFAISGAIEVHPPTGPLRRPVAAPIGNHGVV